MINAIHSIDVLPRLSIQGLAPPATSSGADAFKNLLVDSVGRLDTTQAIPPSAGGVELTAAGTPATIEQTDVTLGVMMQIQDKLLGAYHEIQDMRI
jgi:flagellar hook-basal body complex protein FliE